MGPYITPGGSLSRPKTQSALNLIDGLCRLNDGTRTYVEANTLLEPANNSSAMQHDIEEIREVSTQLSSIKKKHDETKRVCIKKQEELDAIR